MELEYGDLGIATRIIGHDLTMTDRELKRIKAAKEATPTNMASKVNVANVLSDMDETINGDDSEDTDLPF